jgi:hypothetical protein
MIVSNTVRMRGLLAILIGVNVLFFALLVVLIGHGGEHKLRDIESLAYAWFIVLMILAGAVWFTLPVMLNRGLRDIRKILTDVSRGRYNIEFKLYEYDYRKNPEMSDILYAIKAMLSAIQQLDKAKKEKIVEHLGRINCLLKLAGNGFIILSVDGYIRFINDMVTESFPQLEEGANLLGGNFPPEIENTIKRYGTQVLKTRNKVEPQQFFLPSQKRQIELQSQIVKDDESRVTGVVLAIYNLEKKAADRLAELEGLR